jgi:hypothetical protein
VLCGCWCWPITDDMAHNMGDGDVAGAKGEACGLDWCVGW